MKIGADPTRITWLLVVWISGSGTMELPSSEIIGLGIWKQLQAWILFCCIAKFRGLSAEQKQILGLQLLFEFSSWIKANSCLGRSLRPGNLAPESMWHCLECNPPFLPLWLARTAPFFPRSILIWGVVHVSEAEWGHANRIKNMILSCLHFLHAIL